MYTLYQSIDALISILQMVTQKLSEVLEHAQSLTERHKTDSELELDHRSDFEICTLTQTAVLALIP